MRPRPVRPPWIARSSYLALVVVGFAGLVLEVATLVNQGHFGFPDSAIGLWVSAAGLALAGWGVGELLNGDRRQH